MIFDNDAKEKATSFQQMMLEHWISICKRMKLNPYLTYKRMDRRPKCKTQNNTIVRRKHREKFYNIEIGSDFWTIYDSKGKGSQIKNRQSVLPCPRTPSLAYLALGVWPTNSLLASEPSEQLLPEIRIPVKQASHSLDDSATIHPAQSHPFCYLHRCFGWRSQYNCCICAHK